MLFRSERKRDNSIKSKFENNINYAREYLLILLNRYDSVKSKVIEMPEKVKLDTNDYFIENNPVKVYIDAFIEITGNKDDKIKSSTLKDEYDNHSDIKISMSSFIKGLKSNGINNYMSGGYRYFSCIKLKEQKEPEQKEPEQKEPEQKEPEQKKIKKRII